MSENDVNAPSPSIVAKPIKIVASPVNGQIPPIEHRFKPGWKGGGGRPRNHGLVVLEWQNEFTEMGTSEAQLRSISRNKEEKPARRIAANRILRQMENPDLADFHDVSSGAKTLPQLREEGVDTTVVKKIKPTTRTYKTGNTEVTETTTELELRDTSLAETESAMKFTNGSPTQVVQHEGSLALHTSEASDGEIASLIKRLEVTGEVVGGGVAAALGGAGVVQDRDDGVAGQPEAT